MNKLKLKLNMKKIILVLAILILLFIIVIPIVLICVYSIYNNGSFNFTSFVNTIFTNEVCSTFINTLKLGFLVIILSSFIAVPMAFIVVKTDLHFKRAIDIILLIPFMTPPYIEAMGWTIFMQKNGYLQQLLPKLSFLTPHFFTLTGLVIIMSLHIFPFMYLSLKNCLIKINENLEQASFAHGASFLYTLRKVIFPLIFSSYVVGALLIFLRTASEFGAPATFGRKIGYYVLTTEIYKYVSNWPIDFGKASSLSLLLVTTCLILWGFQNLVSSRYSYSLVGGKGTKFHLYKLSRLSKFIAWIYIFIVFIFSTGIPFFAVIVTSLLKVKGLGISAHNFTLSCYSDLFSPGSDAFNALTNTFGISILASCLTMLMGTILGIIIGKGQKGLPYKLVNIFSILPNTIPGIVVVIGLILFFDSKCMPIPIYNTYGMVILTYVVLFLPYTVQYVANSYEQMNHVLEEAGTVFGGNHLYILRKIIIPINSKAMLSGFIMTLIVSIRELVAALMILPPGMENSASFIYSQFEQGNESSGMAMAVITIFITIILIILSKQLSITKKETL